MRDKDKIEKIKETIKNPYSIENFLSEEDIDYLITLFNYSTEKTYKNTGPITVDLKLYENDPVIIKILKKIEQEIGPYDITSFFFFYTDFPHIIHNDDTFELPDNVYKAITLPIKIYGNNSRFPDLCFFNQFYFHGPAKFFKDDPDIPTFYNKIIYEYNHVDNLVDEKIDEKLRLKYFTHLKTSWLEGLSFHSSIAWIPGSAIIFDSVRLHCASDFRKLGITGKLGISIFTKK
jgi:hypothetical protein